MKRLMGVGVSSGVAIGRAVLLVQNARFAHFSIAPGRVPEELARLDTARSRSRRQIEAIKGRIGGSAGPDLAGLFDAQILMLDDPMLVNRAAALVSETRVNAEWAVQQAYDHLSAVFDEVEDPYLRERKGDLTDVVGRLRMNLRHGARPQDLFRDIEGPCVVIADDLTPSIAAQLDWTRIAGFATDAGSRTSHTAILARSLNVPAVVGLHDASAQIEPGMEVLIDADAGAVVVGPSDDEVRLARAQRGVTGSTITPGEMSTGPAVTRDGVHIKLGANIELPGDAAMARAQGADGVGLYRSEFLLASGTADSATEAFQYDLYRRILEDTAPAPVTVRTFDIDEDQVAERMGRTDPTQAWLTLQDRQRGRLGLRGIRLGLQRRDLLRTQLRALLRAARHGQLRIMFPFVSGLDELRAAKAALAHVRSELVAAGEFVPRVPVGVMIEVPSAAFTADLLAMEADFLTIGTNDLIQYCLAVDRADDRVSHLYEPLHPAILRLIRHVRRAAARRALPVSLCGEMASDPALLALLVGFGLTEFSMTLSAIPTARRLLSQISAREMGRMAVRVLRLASAHEIERFLAGALGAGDLSNAVTGEQA